MQKREPLKNEAYLENVHHYYEQKVAEYQKDFETKPPEIKSWENMHMLQVGNYFYLIRAAYSIGKPVGELVPLFDAMIHHWHAYFTSPDVEAENKVRIDSYIEVLQFCSLAILLKSNGATLDKLKAVLELQHIDALLGKFTDYLKIDIKKENKLYFKKAFEPLLSVFNQTSNKEKEVALKSYLTEWMTLLKTAVYTGSHKIKVNDTAFAGYWSFEAAAVCIMEGLDIDAFNEMPFFPADLIAFYLKK